MTPKDLYQEMLRTQLTPALRALGLTGSSAQFFLPSEVCWAGLGFDRLAKATTPTETRFTVNLSVIRKDLWDQARVECPLGFPVRPSPNMGYAGCGLNVGSVWYRRLGQVAPELREQWITLRVGEPYEAVAAAVVGAIRDHGLPALRAQIALQMAAGSAPAPH